MARKGSKSKDKKKKSPRAPAKTSTRGKKTDQGRSSWRFHEGFGILTLAAALLLGPSLLSVQVGDGMLMGPFGAAVGSALNWLLGLCGYLLVVALVVVAVRIFAGGLGQADDGEARHSLWRERVGLAVALLFCSVLLHLIVRPARIDGASAGGIVGELAAELLCSLVSTPGTWVISLAGLALAAVLATNLSWAKVGLALARWLPRLVSALGLAAQRTGQQLRVNAQALYEAARRAPVEAEALDADGAAALPPVIRLDLEDCRILPKNASSPAAKQLPAPMPEDLEIERPPAAAPNINILGDPDQAEDNAAAAEPAAGAKKKKRTRGKKPPPPPKPRKKKGEEPAGELTIVESRFQNKEEGPEEDPEEAQKVEPTDGPGFVLNSDTYQPPPMSLLELEENAGNAVDREAIYAQADLLVKTLADYKIIGRITEVHPGPVITMYEYVPAPGTRIGTVARLADDLAMSLSAKRVRIVAPIPGKGAIGIEVPNESREKVFFKEIVADKTFRKSKSTLTLAMGKNIFGAPVAMDLAKMPHLLVAGATGAGKSVSINTMICSLLMRNTPEQVRMIMVDPKFLELSGYNDIPHLLLPVVTDPKKANVALRWAVNEMERRYQMLADMRVREINAYNKKVDKLRGAAEKDAAEKPGDPNAQDTLQEAKPSRVLVVKRNADGSEAPVDGAESRGDPTTEKPDAGAAEQQAEARPKPAPKKKAKAKKGPLPKRLPHIVVIIDEFADLMMVASKEVETSVARLAQKARAAGIHVILATQRPSVDVITGLIKANFPSRVSFRVAASQDSKTILGCHGAENLLGAGDMLVLDRGDEMKRLHGAFISDPEIQRIVDWLKEQGRPIYDMDILKPPEDDEDAAPEIEEHHDVMYDQAVALVAESRNASISMIQRRLRVGYNRAARMVERMEHEGVVGPPDGPRGREVLIQHHC